MTREAWEQVNNYQPHQAKLSHEVIAAAASYEAAKAWNEHQEKNGVEVSHSKLKEFGAAAAGALVDRLVETKGLDAYDSYKVKQQAQEHFEGQYGQQYNNQSYGEEHRHHHHHRD